MEFKPGTVYFAGAGPGDPELVTLKTDNLIRRADLILYAGSLVNPEVLQSAKSDARILNTAKLPLEQQTAAMKQAAAEGKVIARLHTGDPSLYSSITEQIADLRRNEVPYAVIPGVTAAFAAAASLAIEYTLPEVCQSLILTRGSGKTPVPDAESLKSFAAHRTSMAIYLSTGMLGKVAAQFIDAGYEADTPVAVVYRASWPDEEIIRGTLADIEERTASAGVTHQALIIISPALRDTQSAFSHLYGSYQTSKTNRKPFAILTLSADSVQLGMRLAEALPEADLFIPEKHWLPAWDTDPRIHQFEHGVRQILQETFAQYEALIPIMASGIVVRELAPVMRNKHSDPAVVVMDNQGQFAISLLSGHLGGANSLAQKLAAVTGGQAVITTAGDSQQLPPLDNFIAGHGWKSAPGSNLTAVMGALVDRLPVAVISESPSIPAETFKDFSDQICPDLDQIPDGVRHAILLTARDVRRSEDARLARLDACLILHPKTLWLGVGCNRGTPDTEIEEFCRKVMADAGLAWASLKGVATIPEKADEPGIRDFAGRYGLEFVIIPHERIRAAGSMPTPSAYTAELFGIEGVAEPCALIAAGAASLKVQKQKSPNVTAAIAEEGATA